MFNVRKLKLFSSATILVTIHINVHDTYFIIIFKYIYPREIYTDKRLDFTDPVKSNLSSTSWGADIECIQLNELFADG